MGQIQGQPQELVDFKKLPTESLMTGSLHIPEKAENRTATNRRWLIAFIVCFVIMIPFVGYTLYQSKYRFLLNADSCGNICGLDNSDQFDLDLRCSGKDMTEKPYLEDSDCVSECGPNHEAVLGRCQLSTSDSEISQSNPFSGNEWKVVLSLFFAFGLSVAFLFLFRHAVHMVVWGIIITSIVLLGLVTGGLWFLYLAVTNDRAVKGSLLQFAITSSIVTVIFLCLIAWLWKKIPLVIQLLKEATKAVFDMPGLTGIPLLALITQLVIASVFGVMYFFMLSAGHVTKRLRRVPSSFDDDYEEYTTIEFYIKPDIAIMFTWYYAAFIWVWLSQVVVGVNYMTISGAVSKWYFCNNKAYLDGPISTSAKVVFKFHLGSAFFGGFIITAIAFIKALISSLAKNKKVRVFVVCCIENVEEFLKFLSKNAYIITAMHGTPFLKSGKRAAGLIFQNLKDIIAVNQIGDFILGMAQFLIMLITLLFLALLLYISPSPDENSYPLYFVVGVVAILIAAITFGVFEATIDTLFVCYCEDVMMNDGMARPYYMSKGLMEFMESSKKVCGKKTLNVSHV